MLGLFSLTISSLQASSTRLRSGRMSAPKIDLEKEGKMGDRKARKSKGGRRKPEEKKRTRRMKIKSV